MNLLGNFLVRTGVDLDHGSDLTEEEDRSNRTLVLLPISSGENNFQLVDTGEIVTKESICAVGINYGQYFPFTPEVTGKTPNDTTPIDFYRGGPSTLEGTLIDDTKNQINVEDLLLFSKKDLSDGARLFSKDHEQQLYHPGFTPDTLEKILSQNLQNQCIGFWGVLIFSKDTINDLLVSGTYVHIPYSEEIMFAKDRSLIWNMCMAKARKLGRNIITPSRPILSASRWFDGAPQKFEGNA